MRSLGRLTRLFGALSDESRIRIFLLLRETPLCVCELASILGHEQSRVSHSLRVMRNAGLVDSSRQGKIIVYSIDDEVVRSRLFSALESEIAISEQDLRRLELCKRDDVRGRRTALLLATKDKNNASGFNVKRRSNIEQGNR